MGHQGKLLANQVEQKKYWPTTAKNKHKNEEQQHILKQGTSPCVWVTGITEKFADATVLSNIFGSFGNVMRIKLSKEPDGAQIQLEDAQHAALCCTWLHDVKIGGSQISVTPYKLKFCIPEVSIKSPDEKSKDYLIVNKITHRFSGTNTRGKHLQYQVQKKRALGPVLLIKFEPADKLSELKNYLLESGITVKEIMQVWNQGKMRNEGVAFVEVSSKEEALGALGKLHLTQPTWASHKLYFMLTRKPKADSFAWNKMSKNIPSLDIF